MTYDLKSLVADLRESDPVENPLAAEKAQRAADAIEALSAENARLVAREEEIRADGWAAALEAAAEIIDRERASCETMLLRHKQRDVSLKTVSSWFGDQAALIRSMITEDASPVTK